MVTIGRGQGDTKRTRVLSLRMVEVSGREVGLTFVMFVVLIQIISAPGSDTNFPFSTGCFSFLGTCLLKHNGPDSKNQNIFINSMPSLGKVAVTNPPPPPPPAS